jgi:hypothetical protein
MKSLAYWSRDHKNTARLLIAVCHVMIAGLALYIGTSLKALQLNIPASVFWIAISVFIAVTFLFSKSYKTFSFYARKKLDAVILLSGFVIMVAFSNQKSVEHFVSYNSLHGSFVSKEVEPSKVGSAKPSLKDLKKQLKELRKIARNNNASGGGIALAILTAVLLGYLLLIAVCSLSCSGQDALAVIVLIGGIAGIFFLCKLIIQTTKRKTVAGST